MLVCVAGVCAVLPEFSRHCTSRRQRWKCHHWRTLQH